MILEQPTIQDLINELNKIEDKQRKVLINFNRKLLNKMEVVSDIMPEVIIYPLI